MSSKMGALAACDASVACIDALIVNTWLRLTAPSHYKSYWCGCLRARQPFTARSKRETKRPARQGSEATSYANALLNQGAPAMPAQSYGKCKRFGANSFRPVPQVGRSAGRSCNSSTYGVYFFELTHSARLVIFEAVCQRWAVGSAGRSRTDGSPCSCHNMAATTMYFWLATAHLPTAPRCICNCTAHMHRAALWVIGMHNASHASIKIVKRLGPPCFSHC